MVLEWMILCKFEKKLLFMFLFLFFIFIGTSNFKRVFLETMFSKRETRNVSETDLLDISRA